MRGSRLPLLIVILLVGSTYLLQLLTVVPDTRETHYFLVSLEVDVNGARKESMAIVERRASPTPGPSGGLGGGVTVRGAAPMIDLGGNGWLVLPIWPPVNDVGKPPFQTLLFPAAGQARITLHPLPSNASGAAPHLVVIDRSGGSIKNISRPELLEQFTNGDARVISILVERVPIWYSEALLRAPGSIDANRLNRQNLKGD